MSILDHLPGRAPAPAEPDLVAELENARDELAQVQRAAEIKVAAAQGEVSKAQGALDTFRRSLVADHARAWRGHAEALRGQAEAAGDQTTVISVTTLSADGNVTTKPELAFTRQLRLDEAAQADYRAQLLEDRLLAGDDLNGDVLATLVGQLEEVPAGAEPVAV